MCRGMVSATTYTLVGVVNKFLTVLLNVVLWDKHSTGRCHICITIIVTFIPTNYTNDAYLFDTFTYDS
jgi:hypothetical protein